MKFPLRECATRIEKENRLSTTGEIHRKTERSIFYGPSFL